MKEKDTINKQIRTNIVIQFLFEVESKLESNSLSL